MSRAVAHADVYQSDRLVARIARTVQGSQIHFADSAGPALAYRLPRAAQPIATLGVNLHPFFAGLLPEGGRLKAYVRRLKASEDDLLTLLAATGADCIGDVSVVPEGHALDSADGEGDVDVAGLSEVRFADVFAASVGAKPRGPTISGVQDKVSASMISFPVKASAGGYILKLNPASHALLVENEAFFRPMAKAAGIECAKSELVFDKDQQPGLLVHRFDRVRTKTAIVKVHQEDACQFLNRYPADKYLIDCNEIARGISEVSSAPLLENSKLIGLFAFSYLIGNGDLHAKNVSLYTQLGSGLVTLTPAYDLLTTLPYGDASMAMKLDGRNMMLTAKTFLAFGARHGVRERAVHSILERIADSAPSYIARVDEIGFSAKATAHLKRTMLKRRDELASAAR